MSVARRSRAPLYRAVSAGATGRERQQTVYFCFKARLAAAAAVEVLQNVPFKGSTKDAHKEAPIYTPV